MHGRTREAWCNLMPVLRHITRSFPLWGFTSMRFSTSFCCCPSWVLGWRNDAHVAALTLRARTGRIQVALSSHAWRIRCSVHEKTLS
jgi:hypothetical protein